MAAIPCLSPISTPAGEVLFDLGNSATSKTITAASGQNQKMAMVANITTLTLAGFVSGTVQYITLKLTQDATGSRTIAWPAAVKWGAAGAPTLSGASKVDWVTLWSDDGGTTVYGSYLLAY